MFVLFSGGFVLLSAKSDLSELSQKSEFPCFNYDLDFDVNTI